MQRGKPKVVDCIFQEQEINRHVGTRIRERRVMLGLTQQQVAELIGVTSQQEYKYEAGLNIITVGWLPALADALHAGKTIPIHMDLLLASIRIHTPTTQDWMEGVQQHLPATSHDAIGTEVRKFLQATPKKS